MSRINDKRNVSMMMDLYELTMANGYFLEEDTDTKVAFDVFFRRNPDQGGFSVFAGLEQVLQYLEDMHFDKEDIDYLRGLNHFDEKFLQWLSDFHFSGEVYAFPEGSVIYPNEPIVTVVANIVEAQLVETELLTQINHQSLIATKARRVVRAANGRAVSDFGARRAHNNDAAIYGARAAVIGGVNSTATVSAGQYFDIPVGGTMAHSWVMYYKDELTAFRKFAKIYPDNCILLVDTYDVLSSGIPNAIKVFREMKENGINSKSFGIRIDSGDLAYLTKETRKMLDEAGFPEAKIIISNCLDENTITSILAQGGQVNAFGVGERLITSRSEPVFGAVYKLCAVEENGEMQPRIKVSESVDKITNPGIKEVYRIYNDEGRAIADLIAKKGEEVDLSQPFRFVDPARPWKVYNFENCTAKKMQKLVMKDGKRTEREFSAREIAAYVRDQLSNEIWDEEQRFENPHYHYIDMTPSYYEMKMDILARDDKN
ncbi:nicotinate phosphoribosyltransferase [Oribacterium sp. WCC10]|uniref:nicotinate phosphoribosyltransferase n=1 Tax=Oribacterium sp. WCC10 TaxID=1855343 RepID=UPI0008F33C2E|nr:nicotinate phosphoribosyltransferase [Oribacterium sp. WCC10]SFG66828.1 nicotinate phosphoribosyltransferase [Oribacterium sp. WCC10]